MCSEDEDNGSCWSPFPRRGRTNGDWIAGSDGLLPLPFVAGWPGQRIQPVATRHVNRVEAVLPIRDGLPKLKDFPAEFGGSGELVNE